MSLDPERLADVADDNFASVPDSTTAGTAAVHAGSAEWVVVTGDGHEPVGLLRRTQLSRAAAGQPVGELVKRPVIVLPQELTVAQTLASWPVREFAGAETEVDGVIVVAGDGRPVGVLPGGLDQYRVITRGPGSVDAGLGGTIGVGRIVRTCRFTDPVSAVKCTCRRSFAGPPPSPLPDCRNPAHLTQHLFVW